METNHEQTVLLVEDDSAARKLIARQIQSLGFKVIEATHGLDGVNLYAEISPDIVVTDVNLPFINGRTLTRAIKRSDPLVPVIVVSGLVDQCYPADVVLSKPFSIGDLNAAFNRVTT